jgi:carbon monoxide dehydrogenase subunit G
MKVERDIHINAAPDMVWDLLMDPRRLGDWVSIHRRLKQAPDGVLEQGDELVQSLRLAHKNFDVRWHVKQADKPNKAVWEGRGPVRTKASVIYELQPDGNGGTRFHYVNEFKSPGGPLGGFITDHAFQRRSDREADRTLSSLRGLLEDEPPR